MSGASKAPAPTPVKQGASARAEGGDGASVQAGASGRDHTKPLRAASYEEGAAMLAPSGPPPGATGVVAKGESPRRQPWDTLPPGYKKAPVTIVRPDGTRVNAWDHHVAMRRAEIAAGKLVPQSRHDICDWVQDPGTKQWERAWDSERQTCTTHPAEERRRVTRKALADPSKIPTGPHIIHPDEAQGDGSRIPESKLTALTVRLILQLQPQVVALAPPLSQFASLPVALVELFTEPNVRTALRVVIARAIHDDGWMTHLDVRAWRETPARSLVTEALSNALGPAPLESLARSLAVHARFSRLKAALPSQLARLSAAHRELAVITPTDHELLAYYLACRSVPGARHMAIARLNAYLPARFAIAVTDSREYSREIKAAGDKLASLGI